MSRATGILLTTLLAGCTSIPLESSGTGSPQATSSPATPTSAASSSPSPTASPSPNPTATLAPTESPTPAPTDVATGSPTAQPSPSAQPTASSSADIAALLARVPEHLSTDCHEVSSFDAGFLFGVQCINLPGIDGYVTYYQFDGTTSLNASYEGNRQFFAPDATGTDCSIGPSETSYTVSGTETGRVFCADYEDGQIMTWTSTQLNMEATIVLYGGTYTDLNAVWQDAGPLLEPVGPTTAPSSPTSGGGEWSATAGEHRDELGATFTYNCPPQGREYVIYGTDVYTDDSSVCTAAVHAGLITFAAGGSVVIQIAPGQAAYIATERNGVSSNPWDSWDVSFIFVTT